MSLLTFIDIETTGLDPDRHEVFEVGLIDEEGEHEWWIHCPLGDADPTALRLTRFYERLGGMQETPAEDVVTEIVGRTANKHLVGAVPSFDAAFLERLIRRYAWCPAWHYHLIDVETLAVGHLAAKGVEVTLPWDSESISRSVGVEPDEIDRHTALGDARWAKAIYEAVIR